MEAAEIIKVAMEPHKLTKDSVGGSMATLIILAASVRTQKSTALSTVRIKIGSL